MSKKEQYRGDLIAFLDEFAKGGKSESLEEYIASNSNLPGPRANLKLTQAFMDVVEDHAQEDARQLWDLCVHLAEISAAEAPVNTPQEFIPFCGTAGIGSLASVSPMLFEKALARLRKLANDPRWRMREAVRIGLQRIMTVRCWDTLTALEGWIAEGTTLEMRAVAAAVAEPTLLEDPVLAGRGLQIHEDIVDRVLSIQQRRAEDFKVLRKALGYTLSIVVRAASQPGFEFMVRLATMEDKDIRWIVKENLKKKRLIKHFPNEVESIKELLN